MGSLRDTLSGEALAGSRGIGEPELGEAINREPRLDHDPPVF
jgi:hypothetical protein